MMDRSYAQSNERSRERLQTLIDRLDGEDALPGFRLPVADIFAEA